MIRFLVLTSVFVLCCGFPVMAEEYLVTFQTTDCNGDSGLASVELKKIFKIQTTKCDTPHQQEVRKHVLARSSTDLTEYDVFTVTPEEAERIGSEMKDYMRIRRDLLKKSEGVIITH